MQLCFSGLFWVNIHSFPRFWCELKHIMSVPLFPLAASSKTSKWSKHFNSFHTVYNERENHATSNFQSKTEKQESKLLKKNSYEKLANFWNWTFWRNYATSYYFINESPRFVLWYLLFGLSYRKDGSYKHPEYPNECKKEENHRFERSAPVANALFSVDARETKT